MKIGHVGVHLDCVTAHDVMVTGLAVSNYYASIVQGHRNNAIREGINLADIHISLSASVRESSQSYVLTSGLSQAV